MKLLVTGAWKATKEQFNELIAMGNDILFVQNESDELPEGSYEVDGVICNGFFLYHSIEKFTRLKYVQLTSAGFDRVPMSYISNHDIVINNARGVYSIPMAEFAVCGVLELYKNIRSFEKSRNERTWKKERSIRELCGKTVCVVGCGSVGTEVAKRFSAFECRIVGVDLFSVNNDIYDKVYPLDRLNGALRESDIVVLTLPLTEQTKKLFCNERFDVMKHGTIFVNIARGAIADTDAMIKALNDGKLGGAVLDVFDEEPLSSESVLWSMENVIVTPHNSFVGEGNDMRLWSVIKNNLENYS